MIYEYAIEPEALISWAKERRNCKDIKDNFGIGKTRLMADFPKFKNWRKQFRAATTISSLDDSAKKRLEVLFQLLTETRIERSSWEYDGSHGWLKNAEKEHCHQPFTAILASKNPNNKEYVLLGAEIGDWPEERWEIKDRITVQRQPLAMAEALSSLLLKSREIIFIDPYFRANRKDFRDVLQIFLIEAVKCQAFSEKLRVEVHVSADYENALSEVEFCRECQREMPQLIPAGLPVTIKRLKQRKGSEKLHNRYILTNLGGVSFGIGLNAGEEGETDDLTLLARDQYMKRWEQYACEDGEFELEHKFLIIGKK